MERRLYRSSSDRKLAGVSGGLAEYLDVEPVLVRITWVVVTILTGGAAFLVYVALVFIMPIEEAVEGEALDLSAEEHETGSEEDGVPERAPGKRRRRAGRDPVAESRRRVVGGAVLVVIGVFFLLNNFDLFDWFEWGRYWPVLVILPGLLLIAGRWRGA